MWVLGNCRPLLPLFNLFVHCSSSLHPGFSQLQYGQRLDGSVINSFPEFSLIDCVTECLVTPRCVSVNYCTGAKFCEINYQRKSETKYVMSAGWVYSEKDHWPTDLAGACENSSCNLNETCKHMKYSEDKLYECVLSDCGIPKEIGINIDSVRRENAIGIHRRIHASCSHGYFQFGSGRLICQSNGEWKYDIVCEEGWVQYGNHVYRLFTEQKTWDNAKAYCEAKEAYLAEIESLDENKWIQQFLYSMERCQTILYSCGVWIGGTDQNTESEFIWSRSRNDITFTQWSIGNPNNVFNEDCIEMYSSNGEWNDKRCGSTISFICEKNL